MKANELRLGNYLYWKDEPMRIVDNYSLYKACIDVSRGDKRIKPIPLTEEWLLKFGFEHSRNNWFKLYYREGFDNFLLFGLLIFTLKCV